MVREKSRKRTPSGPLDPLAPFALLLVLVVAAFLLAVSLGAHPLSLGEVLTALFSKENTLGRNIVWNIRLPRALVGALAGACLGVSGGVLQGVMRNPLASPSTIGVTSGAGLAATVCLVLWPNWAGLVLPAAFLGAMGTTFLIYLLAWKNGIQPLRMVLAGMAVSAFVGAVVNALLIFHPDRVQNTLGYTVGSLATACWADVTLLLPYAAVGLAAAFALASRLNLLALGDELCRSLGEHPERVRLACIAAASLLAASAVAVVGLLGFVGLIVPHMARILLGGDFRRLLPASALGGAALVMVCDTASRMVALPAEVPVGILISILGAPFFLYLLRERMDGHA